MASLACPRLPSLSPLRRARDPPDAGPPHKRMKITHPSCFGPALSDAAGGTALLVPAAPPRLLSRGDQSQLRPLTRCHPANADCERREDASLAPERMPPTLLSRSPSHQLLHNLPQRAAKSAVVLSVPCAHATPRDAHYISSPESFAASNLSLPLRPAAAPSAPMSYSFASGDQDSFSSPLSAAGMSYESDILNYLYEGLDQPSCGDFPEEYSRGVFEFPYGERETGCGVEMAPSNAQSPIFRSMSRSSFSSSEYTTASSPADYPTPASDSDSSVTTPAPCEPAFGWLPDLHSVFALHAKSKPSDLASSYVSGSAPLSVDSFFAYALDSCQPASGIPPLGADEGLAGARRHSEPANLAALQFPLFFHAHPAQIAPAAPDASATRPIADSFAYSPSPAAGPSSIAPHQTQLPRPLEILQPKPVRAYKPPFLRGDAQYDPKDFVRRHSEPILPLRELDVFSHLPLDVTEESPEEDDTMAFEGSEDEFYGEDGSSDDMGDEALMDEYAFDSADLEANLGGEPFFDPQWSWYQPLPAPSAAATAPQVAWTGADMLTPNIDWSAFTSNGGRR
ncbi:hypothetical protein C2E23DRAFT_803341 [Lenzites betulinus]|nr:hypothetical protein C2E23DRAFT_803341 [Lenzites betulinus]